MAFFILLALAFLLSSFAAADNLRVVSLNMNGRLDQVDSFKRLLGGENVVCLQEVDDVRGTRAKYKDYPYVYTVTNRATKADKENSIMILSKVPFQGYAENLIQTDPQADKWERHAQYVVLKTDSNKRVYVFHYHNTYNFHDNDSESEREGLTKFTTWVKQVLGVTSFANAENVIVAGDFNLTPGRGADALLQGLNCNSDAVDFVCASMAIRGNGIYNTLDGISDVHNAPWAELDSNVVPSAVVGRSVRIFNTYQNEYLYAADYAPYDNDRRRVFTWRPGTSVTQGYWRLEPAGNGLYRIFNTFQLEYMYAADYEPYDDDRRRIFTWRPGVPVSQGDWQIGGSGDSVTIYNVKQGEYLYAGDYAPYDNDRRRVFSWRPSQLVTQGFWRIE